MNLPAIHLCIVQPAGYVHSLGFLDQARYFRYQFRRMGAVVTLAKNRLRHDAVNIVFGAHLGFDAQAAARHTCLFVNLEQLGARGAPVNAAYLDLLRRHAAIDYHPANLAAYQGLADEVPLIAFGHAPYLADRAALPWEQRPIDLLFFGSMNERRRALIERIERAGRRVSLLERPLYGPERDDLIRHAKAVLNLHFYAPSAEHPCRFEQARAFQCLSLGTPVISERTPGTEVPGHFEQSVHWVAPNDLPGWLASDFDQPSFRARSEAQAAAFQQHDLIDGYADLLAFCAGYRQVHQTRLDTSPWQPRRIHIGSGKDYRPGWLNIDILPAAEPDVLLDLAQPVQWPLQFDSPTHGPVRLNAGSIQTIHASNVLEHVGDLPQMMRNCLDLLTLQGEMHIEVPYEHAPTAWQDPTHVRAINENSWIYYTDWFWYLGWFEHRFELADSSYLDAQLKPCAREGAHFMRVRLRKIETSLEERTRARTLRADFGGLPDDDIWATEPETAPDALTSA
jgi:hypothetical protein